jgi:hypothetical protein
MLASLPKYAPEAKVILFATRNEMHYVDKLRELFPVHAVLQQPAQAQQMQDLLI